MGGEAGSGGGQYVEDLQTGQRRFVSVNGVFLLAADGEVYVGVSTGGGGWGNPHDRDVESVRQDVRDGLISRQAAVDVFGVVLSDGADPRVDEAATAARREQLRGQDRPAVTPTEPNASRWLQDNMREGDVYLRNPQL
jgi:N-methylhydantoinase B